jgi:hypothetical protein
VDTLSSFFNRVKIVREERGERREERGERREERGEEGGGGGKRKKKGRQ